MDSNFPQNSSDTSKTAETETDTPARSFLDLSGVTQCAVEYRQAVQELAHAVKWCAERMSYGDSPEAAAEAYIEMFAVRSQE